MEAIKLDSKWRIEPDAYSWKLIFSEEREKDKLDKKRKKTGEKEKYIYEDDWYFPTIKMCLDRYLAEVFKADKNISEMVERLSGIESKVNQLTGTFKKQ